MEREESSSVQGNFVKHCQEDLRRWVRGCPFFTLFLFMLLDILYGGLGYSGVVISWRIEVYFLYVLNSQLWRYTSKQIWIGVGDVR